MAESDILAEIQTHNEALRKEMADLRTQVEGDRRARGIATASTQVITDPEELLAARMAAVEQHPFYCPACGRLGDYAQKCAGRGEAPHPVTEMVSTDELTGGDPTQHTPAPDSVAPDTANLPNL